MYVYIYIYTHISYNTTTTNNNNDDNDDNNMVHPLAALRRPPSREREQDPREARPCQGAQAPCFFGPVGSRTPAAVNEHTATRNGNYLSICKYVYIYIYIERERDR